MRILVLGDIHSNWPALAAVAEDAGPVDAVLCTGDVVDYGADPAECVAWVRRHATAAVRGNHDHAVAQRVPPKGGSGLKSLAAATRPRHWEMLPPRDLRLLGRLPVTAQLSLGGRSFFLVHGTPHDPLDEYAPADADFWRDRLARIDADFVCVGHTHQPFVLPLPAADGGGGPTVLNPGSVGQPRDGDPRAAYALITDGVPTLHRVAYDVEGELRRLARFGVPAPELSLAEGLLRNGGV